MKPCFSCIRISAGPLGWSSDRALRIPARSKCRRIRFRHWEAGLSAECRGTRRLNSTTATTSESSGVRTADRNEEATVCLSPGRRCSKVRIGALAITSERRTTMEAHCQHRFWGNARKCLVLAGTLAAAVTLVSPGSLEAASPTTDAIQSQISTHDAAQAQQHGTSSQEHQSVPGAITNHDSAQTTQHTAVQGQISPHDTGQTQQHLSITVPAAAHDNAQTTQHTAVQGQIGTHDTAQTQQHLSITGPAEAHNTAQTTQHDALSQQIANLSTGGGDQSGLPPTWDKALSADNPADPCSSSRFKCVMGGEAVRDNETGLVWEKSPSPTLQLWQNARGICATKTVGGRKGWRLSSIEELASLIDSSVPSPGPTLPSGHPFLNVQLDAYWAATTDATVSTNAWVGDFTDGSVHVLSKVFTLLVCCVRGDGPLSQY